MEPADEQNPPPDEHGEMRLIEYCLEKQDFHKVAADVAGTIPPCGRCLIKRFTSRADPVNEEANFSRLKRFADQLEAAIRDFFVRHDYRDRDYDRLLRNIARWFQKSAIRSWRKKTGGRAKWPDRLKKICENAPKKSAHDALSRRIIEHEKLDKMLDDYQGKGNRDPADANAHWRRQFEQLLEYYYSAIDQELQRSKSELLIAVNQQKKRQVKALMEYHKASRMITQAAALLSAATTREKRGIPVTQARRTAASAQESRPPSAEPVNDLPMELQEGESSQGGESSIEQSEQPLVIDEDKGLLPSLMESEPAEAESTEAE
ncbi:MAG: hypothetical protein MJA29_05580, partial [Candidatus Omnitrophica bacterium]|nr:hypothetical protein [Candidatus Omnitrophota bacterium]